MDHLTERAITHLRKDGRAAYSTIAKNLSTTRANVSQRLSPLFANGSLRVIAAIHPRVLGLEILAHLSLRVTGSLRGLIASLMQMDSVVFTSETTGHYQIIAEIHTHSIHQLHEEVAKIRSSPGVIEGQVLQYEHVYSSFFLGEEPDLQGFLLDDTNLRLAQQLQLNGRTSFAELAEHTGLSVSATRDRVTRLLDSGAMQIGVVRGRNSAGSELVFGFGFTTSYPTDGLIQVLRAQQGLEFLAHTIGRHDVVTTISFSSISGFTELIHELRMREEIHTIDTWLHSSIHLERYIHSHGEDRETR